MPNDGTSASSSSSPAPSSAPVASTNPAPSAAPTSSQAPDSGGVSTGSAPSATPNPTASAARFKVKVDGREVEVTQDELLRGYSVNSAAQRRMDEAARIKREADARQQRFEAAKKDPKLARQVLLETLPPEVLNQVAEELIYEQIEQHQMSPEQRRIAELEQELARQAEEREQQAQAAQQQEYEQAFQQNVQEFNKTILETLQKAKVPATEWTAQRTAAYMAENRRYKLGYSPDQIAAQVADEYQGEMRSYAEAMDGEALLAWLGDKVANKIRKADLARIRSRNGAPPPPAPTDAPKIGAGDEQAKPTERIDIHEFRRRLDERTRGG